MLLGKDEYFPIEQRLKNLSTLGNLSILAIYDLSRNEPEPDDKVPKYESYRVSHHV